MTEQERIAELEEALSQEKLRSEHRKRIAKVRTKQLSMCAARANELERQVLGLREALQEVVTISDRKHDAWDKAKQALTDTEQAGREAEHRIIHAAMQSALDKLGDHSTCDWCDGYKVALFRVGDAAPRLRNGGSDNG